MPEIDPRDAAMARHDEAARRRRDAQRRKDRAAQAQAAFDCGQALVDLGDLGPAHRLFDEARREIEESGLRVELLPDALGMIGRTQQRAHRWDDVLPRYRRAADAAAAQGLAVQQPRWLHKEAAMLFDMKQPETGLARMREALTLGRAMRDVGQAVQETLVDILCRLGDEEPHASDAEPLWAEAESVVWTNADIFGDVLADSGLLAVLSGCESGQTQPNLVNEEVSLPAAFLAAGFRAVVATRWAVHDLSATLLAAEFHRRWREGGIGVAAALAGARRWLANLTREQARALLRGVAQVAPQALGERAAMARAACAQAEKMLDTLVGNRPFADPWHWAAFYVSGDGALQAQSPMPATTPSPSVP